MKFSIIFLLVGLVCGPSLIAAKNYPLIVQRYDPIGVDYDLPVDFSLALIQPTGIMDDVWGWIKSAAKGTSAAFMKMVNAIVSHIMSLISKWKGANYDVVISLGSRLFKLKDLADDYLIQLGDQVHELLDGFEGTINKVLDILAGKFNEAMDKANHTLFNSTTQLQDWRDGLEVRLKAEAPHRYDEAIKIIEEFTNTSVKEVFSCSEGAIQPIRNLFDKCGAIVNETLPLARDLVDSVQTCIFEGGWDISGIQKCMIEIKDGFVITIKEFPAKILALKTEILKLIIDELFNLPCIAGSRIKMEAGKRKINQQIEEMIQGKLFLAYLMP